MTSDLLVQLQEYGRQLDAEATPLSLAPSTAVDRRRPLLQRPWVVVATAAVATLFIVGAAALLLRGDSVTPADTTIPVPETWTVYTSAEDGIVSECLCQMVLADDGSIWVVGWDGISRFDGTQWDRIEPPRPFSGEGWPAVVAAPDGSVWVMGMAYISQYTDGTWGPTVEAGFQEDGGPLWFQGLSIDADGQVWTNLEDVDGVILDGAFVPREWPEEPPSDDYVPPEGLGILATAPDGTIWMAMGDSIIGVEGALVEYDGERMIRHALGGVESAAFEEDGTGWFLVPEVGEDAWMYGREQWSPPGLYRLEDGDWYRITTSDGLPGYRVSGMLVAPDGAFWLSDATGAVTRYQPGTQPQSGTRIDIESRPFSEADVPPPAYPPITDAPLTHAGE